MIDRHQMEKCVYVLPNFAPPNIGETLKSIAESDHAFLPADIYGQGGACEEVATRLKKMFDKPAARFCVKGMIAQMAVLRAVTEFTGNNRVVVHRASHLDYDEMEAVEILHPIQFLRLAITIILSPLMIWMRWGKSPQQFVLNCHCGAQATDCCLMLNYKKNFHMVPRA